MRQNPFKQTRKAHCITTTMLIFAASILNSKAANGDITTLINNGSSSNRVDIVFLGDGYTSTQQNTYTSHINNAIQYIFHGGALVDPLPRYSKFFNIHKIEVTSLQSGADDPSTNTYVNTALGATYKFDGLTQRLLYVNESLANTLLPENTGKGFTSDIRFVTVNDAQYGGAGGSYAVFSGAHADSLDIAVHEIGHSFANLADEYGDYNSAQNTVYQGAEPIERNVTTDPTGAKWKNWIGYDDPHTGIVGAYEEAKYHDKGLYRPSIESKMRVLNTAFDPISKETFISSIYDIVRPIDTYNDISGTIDVELGDPNKSSLWIKTVDPTIFSQRWYIDGILIENETGASLNPLNYIQDANTHIIKVITYDATDLVRDAEVIKKMSQELTWSIALGNVLSADGDYLVKDGTVTTQLAGNHGMRKITKGVATLQNSNTYTRGSYIEEGRLILSNGNALGTGLVEVLNDAILDIGDVHLTGVSSITLKAGSIVGGGSITAPQIELQSGLISANISGTSAVSKTTAGMVTISGKNTFTGGLTLTDGTLIANGSSSLGNGDVNVNGGILLIQAPDAAQFSTLNVEGGRISLGELKHVMIGSIKGVGTFGLQNESSDPIELTLGLNNSTDTYSGGFSGAGSLVKAGTGTLTLTGATTHTGSTSVNNGALVITRADALGTGPLYVNNGKLDIGSAAVEGISHFTLNGGSVVSTAAGSISATEFELRAGSVLTTLKGAGTLLKTGTDTVTLTSANTYRGGTTVNDGTLLVKHSQALSSGAITVNGGTLQLETSIYGLPSVNLKSGTLTGRIGSISAGAYDLENGIVSLRLNGAAALVKNTNGKVLLTKDNAYAGGTTINGGTLVITHQYALGKGTTIVNTGGTLQVGDNGEFGAEWSGKEIRLAGGTLDVALASSTTVSRHITGTGDIHLRGTGEITFTNATNIGNTIVDSGTLVLTDGVTMAGYVTVNPSGVVEIRSTTSPLEVNQSVYGTGAVRIGGTGETRLTGKIATRGTLEILSGAQATLGSPETATTPATPATLDNHIVYIRQNAVLGGVGSISGTIINEGTLSPGFSPGAITLAGDFVNTGTLRMEIGATGEHDEIRFGGQAFLSGHLQIVYLGATPAKGTILTLLTDTNTVANQPSIIGNFSQVSIVGATNGISFVNGAELKFVVDGTIFDIPGAALPQSARLDDFAQALYALSQSDSTIAAVASPLTVSGASLAATYRAASPLGYAAAAAMPVDQAQADSDNLYRHLQSRRYERPSSWLMDYSPYVEAGGASATADSGKDGRAFDHTSVGGSVGVDLEPAQDLLIGAKVGYDAGKAKFHHGAGELAQDHMRVAVYASQLIDTRYFVDASLALGYSLYDSKHNTPLGRQKADSTGWDVSASVNAGFVAPISASLSLTPHIGLVATRTQTSGFKEDGSPLALNLDGIDQNSLATRAGVGLNQLTRIGDTRVRLTLDASWMHELLDEEVDIGGDIAGHGFTMSAVAGIKDRLQVGPGADFLLDDNRAISVDYKFDYAFGDATAHRLDISYRTRF